MASGSRSSHPLCAGRYRKRPVVIEAFPVDDLMTGLIEHFPPWVLRARRLNVISPAEGGRGYLVKTLEGVMLAERGDMLICGVKGEIYPCKPEIFAATYELVAQGTPGPSEADHECG